MMINFDHLNLLGIPHQSGGRTARGCDCLGLLWLMLTHAGLTGAWTGAMAQLGETDSYPEAWDQAPDFRLEHFVAALGEKAFMPYERGDILCFAERPETGPTNIIAIYLQGGLMLAMGRKSLVVPLMELRDRLRGAVRING